jgi:methylase of polypeptide subunit release factors
VPLEHVLGWVEFCGLRIAVDPGVFVPRRRTELLVRQAAERQAPHTVEIFTRNGLMPRVACLDELDATVVIGTKTRPQDSVRMM